MQTHKQLEQTMADPMNLFEVMYNCRAMRRLESREIPEDLLVKLIDAANQAPSGSNQQRARWVIARDPAVKQALADLNKKAVDAYVEIKPLFPVGSEVFKPLYSDAEGKEFARLVIMVKMEEGYDSDNGDWWYGVYDESGTEMAYEGRIPECIRCHKMAIETDYLFSRSVMKKLDGIDTNEFEEYEPDDGEDY